MFNIISPEVYRADPYVFLRELLQNSIDAIRLRREILRVNNIEPSGVGVIRVSIEQQGAGHSLIIWDDDGIGMDEAVVRHYLAVAGKSYYRSAEFERKDIRFDPIARFGIGLLSCFTVAERVEIETRPEPYFHEAPEALTITIPAMRRHFRIATAPASSRRVGTTVKVFVEHHRVLAVTNGALEGLTDVTTYLCNIAGFVEFPIVVSEGGAQTVIVHPTEVASRVRKRFGENCRVHKLNLGYRWSDGILPQDERAARTILAAKAFDLRDDLGLE